MRFRSSLAAVSRFKIGVPVWAAFVVAAALAGIAHWPTTTRYGIDFQAHRRTIPLYQKSIEFVSRDLQIGTLARQIADGAASDPEIVERVFDWVRRNVRPVPEAFPIVDDHVWNTIVRGYGADDQRTEVFTLLTSYACCAATPVGSGCGATEEHHGRGRQRWRNATRR
jgi:hypothetical protein